MSSNQRHIWEGHHSKAPQMTTIETLSAWCHACRPSLFIISFAVLLLGLFIAKKHSDVTSLVQYALGVMLFSMHTACNMLVQLAAYIMGNDKAAKANNFEERGFCPRTMTLSFLAFIVLSVVNGTWLAVQSGQPWLCLVLFISLFAGIFHKTVSSQARPTFGTLFLQFQVYLAIFGTTYAVASHNFAPYYLALTIPVSLFIAVMVHIQHDANPTNRLTWRQIFKTLVGKAPTKNVSCVCYGIFWAVMLNLITTYVPCVNIEKTMLIPPVQKTTLEHHSSTSIEASSQDAIERGVVYGFGAKNSNTGAIDCSGWIAEINQKMMQSLNAQMGKEVYGDKAKTTLIVGANGGAAGLILAVSVITGEQLLNEDLTPDKVREGLTIGLDTGAKDWDTGRYAGIDHIVQTYKNHTTGQMMVSQSSGGIGVHVMPYADWYAKWGKEAKLYGVDISLLADSAPVPAL